MQILPHYIVAVRQKQQQQKLVSPQSTTFQKKKLNKKLHQMEIQIEEQSIELNFTRKQKSINMEIQRASAMCVYDASLT